MNKLSITVTVLVVLGAGALAWFFWGRGETSTQQNPQTLTPGQSFGNNQTTVTLPSGGSSSSEETLADVELQYTLLFTELGIEKMVFTRTTESSAGDRGALYKISFPTDELAQYKSFYPAVKDFSTGIALVDLTEDGLVEGIVQKDLPGYCGTAGCPLEIYKKEKGVWVKVFEILAFPTVGVAPLIRNDHADLALTLQNAVVRFGYDGKEYKELGVFAHWDGAQFIVAK